MTQLRVHPEVAGALADGQAVVALESTIIAHGLPFPANRVMVRELDYVGAFRANGEFDLAVQAIRTRRADVRPLISAQVPLARAQEAFELAADRSRSTKVQLVYE